MRRRWRAKEEQGHLIIDASVGQIVIYLGCGLLRFFFFFIFLVPFANEPPNLFYPRAEQTRKLSAVPVARERRMLFMLNWRHRGGGWGGEEGFRRCGDRREQGISLGAFLNFLSSPIFVSLCIIKK
jgi:hypothetical protein